MPQAAHLANGMANPATESQMSLPNQTQSDTHEPRPIHLLRAPSFNPPAFEEDSAPPPLEPILVSDELPTHTPPPQYDVVIGTPSVDGMADYFSRLADYGFDDGNESGSDESDLTPPRILNRSGRVNVAHPHTPGGRMPSRSMEISRPIPDLHMGALATQPAATTAGN